ncbi:MAG: methyltransferase [Alphaproteobacteria bacterium]
MFSGFAFQIWAKLTLRKRFGIVAANRGVQARGPYALVRHPMYAGYTITEIGFFLAHPSLWNGVVYMGAVSFQILRILAEERYLARDPAYGDLRTRVRWRLVPGVF